jgi:uncharacterized protein YbcC (UPF0753/DUF2309 family)
VSLQVRAAVARATRTVVPFWPLSSFIAVNPLGGHEQEDFENAAPMRAADSFRADYTASRITDRDLVASVLQRAPELAGGGSVTIGHRVWSAPELAVVELVRTNLSVTASATPHIDRVDELTSKWVAAYLDPHPLWGMPDRERGFWAAFAAMARHDPQLPAAARRRLRELPDSADAGLETALARLGVDDTALEVALGHESQGTPGWSAHVKWRAEHVGDIDLTSYLAVRMTLRWALGLPAATVAPAAPQQIAADASVWDRADHLTAMLSQDRHRPDIRAQVARILALHPWRLHDGTWQLAYELGYRRQLMSSLSRPDPGRRDAWVQVVLCIDPRSEGMRRHLEANADIETYGFAGFFGIPIRFASFLARGSIDALPALLAPRHTVGEITSDPDRGVRRTRALRVRDAFAAGLHAGETAPAAPFALAETLGWFSGAGTLLRTLAPMATAKAAERLRRVSTPELDTEVTVASAFSLEERAALAENGIRMMGLDRFAELVILTGHASTSTNNLYQSALDCGACGGNPGGANARAAAAIFNDPEVRGILADRGLAIPSTTWFVAAEHNTSSDRIHILDDHLIPDSHASVVAKFLKIQDVAADGLVAERAVQLPGAARHSPARVRARAHDWAEVYPELGLAGNAAMIIGPREMTLGVDLERRVFLHSYRPELDPDGSALETIMTAPLVVAQWINHQYYFSTVDGERWGAGTKTIHNAIGTIGVISGQSGDLRLGLPLQSVAVGDRLLHEPMRLHVVIQAPLELIGAIVSRNQVLRNLFDNNWISLTARNDRHEPWHRYDTHGWIPTRESDQKPGD